MCIDMYVAMYINICVDMCKDTCMEMCADGIFWTGDGKACRIAMCIDMSTDTHVGNRYACRPVHRGMSRDIGIDMWSGTCIDMCINMCIIV